MQHGSSLVRSSLYHPFMLLCCDFAVSPLESGQIAEKQRRNNEEASKDDRRKNPKVIKAAPTKKTNAKATAHPFGLWAKVLDLLIYLDTQPLRIGL